jgi:hypothetical protein
VCDLEVAHRRQVGQQRQVAGGQADGGERRVDGVAPAAARQLDGSTLVGHQLHQVRQHGSGQLLPAACSSLGYGRRAGVSVVGVVVRSHLQHSTHTRGTVLQHAPPAHPCTPPGSCPCSEQRWSLDGGRRAVLLSDRERQRGGALAERAPLTLVTAWQPVKKRVTRRDSRCFIQAGLSALPPQTPPPPIINSTTTHGPRPRHPSVGRRASERAAAATTLGAAAGLCHPRRRLPSHQCVRWGNGSSGCCGGGAARHTPRSRSSPQFDVPACTLHTPHRRTTTAATATATTAAAVCPRTAAAAAAAAAGSGRAVPAATPGWQWLPGAAAARGACGTAAHLPARAERRRAPADAQQLRRAAADDLPRLLLVGAHARDARVGLLRLAGEF